MVDRHGTHTLRNRAVLDDAATLLASTVSLPDAIGLVMPTLTLTPDEITDLRYGRRLDREVGTVCGGIDPSTHEAVAIVKPDGTGRAQPVVVFPAEE